MNTKIFVLLISFLLFSIYFVKPHTIYAQTYGTYSCFSNSSTGGCRLSSQNDCTNGGVIPNTTQCEGLPPAECNSDSFPCDPPGSCSQAGLSCTDASDCCSGLNCLNSFCVTSSDGFTKGPPPKAPAFCDGGNGLVTAIGCLRILTGDFTSISKSMLQLGMGLAGGIALVLIFIAGFMVMTSAGNPQKLTAGKELLTAAVMGLLMLVFAGFILRFIGVDILGLNQFGLTK